MISFPPNNLLYSKRLNLYSLVQFRIISYLVQSRIVSYLVQSRIISYLVQSRIVPDLTINIPGFTDTTAPHGGMSIKVI